VPIVAAREREGGQKQRKLVLLVERENDESNKIKGVVAKTKRKENDDNEENIVFIAIP
jgi:hypothetical protein